GGGGDVVLPQDLACIFVAGADLAVRGGAVEHQPAGGGDGAAARNVAAGVLDALLGQRRDLAVRHLPDDLAAIHVVGGDRRPRRGDGRQAVGLQHEVDGGL